MLPLLLPADNHADRQAERLNCAGPTGGTSCAQMFEFSSPSRAPDARVHGRQASKPADEDLLAKMPCVQPLKSKIF